MPELLVTHALRLPPKETSHIPSPEILCHQVPKRIPREKRHSDMKKESPCTKVCAVQHLIKGGIHSWILGIAVMYDGKDRGNWQRARCMFMALRVVEILQVYSLSERIRGHFQEMPTALPHCGGSRSSERLAALQHGRYPRSSIFRSMVQVTYQSLQTPHSVLIIACPRMRLSSTGHEKLATSVRWRV
jgi:hypothetical protein